MHLVRKDFPVPGPPCTSNCSGAGHKDPLSSESCFFYSKKVRLAFFIYYTCLLRLVLPGNTIRIALVLRIGKNLVGSCRRPVHRLYVVLFHQEQHPFHHSFELLLFPIINKAAKLSYVGNFIFSLGLTSSFFSFNNISSIEGSLSASR